MSARKRPLAELSQPSTYPTPSRYAPSTPHARRALQERNSAKRSARSINKTGLVATAGRNRANAAAIDLIRPDGSARNILRQFARLTAPVTKRRISTPVQKSLDKENARPNLDEGEDDSILGRRPNLTFRIEDSIEEDDSELPVAPTPSVLPDEDDSDDDGVEQPTITFQNIARAASEGIDRRRSRPSLAYRAATEVGSDGEEEQEGDATIMTERGRRALSEEATGRFSRYSFGSIRMSDFGSELEIRRESDRQQKLLDLESEDDYNVIDGDDMLDLGGNTEDLRNLQRSPSSERPIDDSMQIPGFSDDTFQLPMPEDDGEQQNVAERALTNGVPRPVFNTSPTKSLSGSDADLGATRSDLDMEDEVPISRQQTQLEMANHKAQESRRKKLKLTRHGNVVPCLPSSLIKRVAVETQTKQGKRKPKFGRDHVKALEQATEWFFEQVGEDLAAYSSHGRRRKRVDDDDVLLLLRRHKTLASKGELKRLAKEWLPKEMLAEIELPDDL